MGFKINSKIIILLIAVAYNGVVFASIEATNLMSEALKQRNTGNLKKAVTLLRKATSLSDKGKQRNLSMFMLGDCFLESEDYENAVKTYESILINKLTAEEKSEALFCLMKAYASLGDADKVTHTYNKMMKETPSGSYSSLAKTFYSRFSGVFSGVAGENKNTQQKAKIVAKPVVLKTNQKQQKQTKTNTQVNKNKQIKTDTNKQTKPTQTNINTNKQLQEALAFEPVSDSRKEELVSEILVLQDKIKNIGETKPGADALLFELGKNTSDFGELVEACKIYDKLLSLHPNSSYAERAYYEAIRLRAVLGVHEAVVAWAKAFNEAFPSSVYASKVKALSEYSKSGGKIAVENKKTVLQKDNFSQIKDKNLLVKDESYILASKKMKDGDYESALKDFMGLTREYSQVPQLWWDIALVNVQTENFKNASIAINKMLKLDPGNEDASSLSGYIHYRLEDYEEAANAYENAGEPDGQGVNFYDTKSALKRMKKSVNTTY
jgi:tetratricopeptide (TPR) repeat protein